MTIMNKVFKISCLDFKYTNVQVKSLDLEYFNKSCKSWIEK
jgi:hypothetical protein